MNYFNGLKKTLPRLWNDRVRIVGIQPVKKGYITNNEDVTIVENEPAKVVLKGQSPSEQSSLFLSPNQPSSKTNNSIPRLLDSLAISLIFSLLKSK